MHRSPTAKGTTLKKLARWSLQAIAVAGLSLLAAEGLVRLLGLAPGVYPAPRTLENARKRFALDCYPTDPRRAFPLDLSDAALRRRLAGEHGLDRAALEALVADGLIHCVPLVYNAQTCREAPFEPDSVPSPAPHLPAARIGPSGKEATRPKTSEEHIAKCEAGIQNIRA